MVFALIITSIHFHGTTDWLPRHHEIRMPPLELLDRHGDDHPQEAFNLALLTWKKRLWLLPRGGTKQIFMTRGSAPRSNPLPFKVARLDFLGGIPQKFEH